MNEPAIRYTRTSDGARIAYRLSVGGAGVRVLPISWPGLLTLPTLRDVPAFVACSDAIRSGRPSVGFDWRGLGFSGPIGERLTVAEQTMDIEAVCDAVGEAMDVVAWCTACFAVVPLAVHRPELFRTLTLVAPDCEGCDSHYGPFWTMRFGVPEVEWLEVALRRGADVTPAVARAAAQRLLEFAPAEASRAHMRAFLAGSLDGLLPRLTVPTAVLSHPGSLPQSSRVAEQIPGCIFHLADEFTYSSCESGILIRRAIDALHSASGGGQSDQPSDKIQFSVDNREAALSPREVDVLRLVAAGKSNAQIADALTLSTRTVERHVQNIYGKLGVHNRAAAVAWAIRNGLA
ncbi:MAG: alpha/beta fold hydrolase [Dehalococcoidia bacterium]